MESIPLALVIVSRFHQKISPRLKDVVQPVIVVERIISSSERVVPGDCVFGNVGRGSPTRDLPYIDRAGGLVSVAAIHPMIVPLNGATQGAPLVPCGKLRDPDPSAANQLQKDLVGRWRQVIRIWSYRASGASWTRDPYSR
jgi:hypothetical protein